jgi:2-oxo-3-hexenedioate decarboxylase
MKQTNQALAITLDNAAKTAKAVTQISTFQTVTLTDAYTIQAISIAQRYERGEKLVGLKLGFTSKAKMEQMGVHDMIWGRLTDKMKYQNGDDLPKSKFIHPRAEPEIAFLIKADITEELTLETAPNFIESVAGAIEIIDSRYENFKFSLEDVIADNCSSTGFVIGSWLSPNTNLSDLKIDLKVDGKIVATGSSDAILGNPWESVVAAARLSLQYNEPLKKGMILLAGAATSAVFVQIGQTVEAEIEGLGNVKLQVK